MSVVDLDDEHGCEDGADKAGDEGNRYVPPARTSSHSYFQEPSIYDGSQGRMVSLSCACNAVCRRSGTSPAGGAPGTCISRMERRSMK